jgi:hypothetical protein
MIRVSSAPEYVLFSVCFVFTAFYPTIELEVCTLGNRVKVCVISGFRREVDANCALLGYYAASSGNFLPTW